MHEMRLEEVYYNLIKERTKIFEIRLNDEKRQELKVGDKILLKKRPDCKETMIVEVEDLIYFKSFEDMLKNISLKEIGLSNLTEKETVDLYHSFYSVEDEQKYGVVAIKIK
ncbi:MAG: ASCH domain-containing protein [Clostridia bacterium]|nr:ASCH domain-containing protein [Clostridia bacterium]